MPAIPAQPRTLARSPMASPPGKPLISAEQVTIPVMLLAWSIAELRSLTGDVPAFHFHYRFQPGRWFELRAHFLALARKE